MEKLKRCPFCGSEATTKYSNDLGYRADCTECGAGVELYNTETKAIKTWNKRYTNPIDI